MRSITEILFSPKEVDVVLIQPNFLMRILAEKQSEIVRSYWNSMDNNEPLGDTANEVNHGLFSLASSVLNAGYSVEILDFQAYDRHLRKTENRMICEEDIEKAIKCNKALLYGISTITVASENALKIGECIRQEHPDALIAYGGMHPTLFGDMFIKENVVDIIMLGEGNRSLVQLLSSIKEHSSMDSIKGIYYKSEDSSVHKTEKQSINTVDLDTLPYPAYDLMCKESLPFMPRFFTSKGCPFHCAFCSCNTFYENSYDDYKIIYRDPIKVVDEIEFTYNKYHMEYFCFGDLTFMTNKKHVHSVCHELIKRNLSHVKWWCQTTVGSLQEDDLDIMKRAGCEQVGLGVENSIQRNLDKMGKPIYFDAAENQCKLIRNAGIDPIAYWIIGLGDNSIEGAIKTIDRICYFVRNNLTEVSHIGVPVPYPGSPLWESPEQYGLTIVNNNFSEYWMNSDELGYSKPAIRTDALSSDHIYALWEYALMVVSEEYRKRTIVRGGSTNEKAL